MAVSISCWAFLIMGKCTVLEAIWEPSGSNTTDYRRLVSLSIIPQEFTVARRAQVILSNQFCVYHDGGRE